MSRWDGGRVFDAGSGEWEEREEDTNSIVDGGEVGRRG